MTTKRKARAMGALVAQPQTFVARLILADLISKRGDGPLQRKMLVYQRRKR
jgi:hypothetical protein